MDTISQAARGRKIGRNFVPAEVDFNCDTCTRKKRNMQPNSSSNGEMECTNGCYQEWLIKSTAASSANNAA